MSAFNRKLRSILDADLTPSRKASEIEKLVKQRDDGRVLELMRVIDGQGKQLAEARAALSRAAVPEPEWEYRLDTDRTWDGYPLYAIGSSIEEAKANVLKYAPHAKVSFTNPRRRTKGVDPGPWEPLPVEGDDAAL